MIVAKAANGYSFTGKNGPRLCSLAPQLSSPVRTPSTSDVLLCQHPHSHRHRFCTSSAQHAAARVRSTCNRAEMSTDSRLAVFPNGDAT
eukprot:2773474-Pleurochrysis_carterae.AAC.1